MLNRMLFLSLLCFSTLAVVGCAPPPEPPAEEEPPPPPPPPPTVYDLGEVDVVAEEAGFSSENVSFAGVQIGDVTNDMLDVLGDQVGNTVNSVDQLDYVTAYHDGGLLIYSFKQTGRIRKIEIMTRMAEDVASPQIRAWLEDGDLDLIPELMGGGNQGVEEIPETEATEYVYDSRGIRFVVYPNEQYSIRFSDF